MPILILIGNVAAVLLLLLLSFLFIRRARIQIQLKNHHTKDFIKRRESERERQIQKNLIKSINWFDL